MRFGPVRLDEARGAVLAHTLRLPDGTIKKGAELTDAHIARLAAAGIESVVAARLEPGDIAEDAAAARVAAAVAGSATRVAEAFTGRANILAAAAGVTLIDHDRLVALNRIDEGLTVATVAAGEAVAEGQMLATVKIIPFALPAAVVERAEALCAEGPPILQLAPFRAKKAGLVLTRFDWTAEKLLAKREKAIADRLEAAGSRLARVETCAHQEAAIAAAVARLAEEGCDPVLVFGAAAIADRNDVIPQGVVRAGGTLEHLGMPVDPGNLLLVARIGARDVIGVPSCAGSPQFNGFDRVLVRCLAGLRVGGEEIAEMALGGLLKEVPSRPQPRQGRPPERDAATPSVAAIVLAAGRSSRMAPRNKLVEPLGGAVLVRHVVEAVLASRARPVLVVTGHQAPRVEQALAGLDVATVRNPRFREGLSTSLRAGLDALTGDIDGVLVCLGDMPAIEARHLDALIDAFETGGRRVICVPVRGGKRGNPVLWPAALMPQMRQVKGDVGARHLIGEHEDLVVEVDLGSDAIFSDIDTPADLAGARNRA